MKIGLVKLHQDAVLPSYMSEGAAGVDLCCILDAPLLLKPGRRVILPTGIALEIPHGYEGQVRPRSGLAAKHGITVANAPGTIDSDYRGEVKVILINLGQEPFEIRSGERIAQLVFAPVVRAALSFSDAPLGETSRGTGGFGSTGA